MKAERHLFGSFDGYQTLAASPGVADAEAAELSEFGFGQTSDQATLEGLSRRLCVLGRPLSSGRIALTRVFSGRPDDAGRPTIELRTIILDAAGFESVRHDLRAFFGHPAHWDETGFREGLVANVSSSTTRSTPSRDAWYLVDSWMKLGNRRDLVLRLFDDARSEDAILAAVGAVDPRDAANLRWGLFLFSTSAAADVCTLAGSASLSARRQVVDLPLEQDRWRHPHLAAMALRNDPMPPFQRLVQAPISESGVALEADGTPRRPGRPGSKTPNGQRSRLLMIAGSIGALLIGVIVMLALWPAPKKPMSPTQVAGVMETNQDGERLPESNSNEDRGSAPPVGEDPDPDAESIPVEASSEEDAHASEPTTNVPPEKGAPPIGSNGGTSQVNDRDVGKSRRNRLVVEDPLPPEDAMVPEPSNGGGGQEDSKRKSPKLTDAVILKIRALIAELKDANGEFSRALKQASEKQPPSLTGNFGAAQEEKKKAEQTAWKSRVRSAKEAAKEKEKEVLDLKWHLRAMAFLAPNRQLEAWVSGLGCELLADFDPDIWVYAVQRLLEDNPLENPTSKPEFEALLASKIPSGDVACLERLVERLTDFTTVLQEIEQQFSMAEINLGNFNVLLDEPKQKNGSKLPLVNQLKVLSKDVPGFRGVDTLPEWMKAWRRIWSQVLKKKESQSQSGGN